MKKFFPQIVAFFSCGVSLVLFGCDNQRDALTPGVNAFDQSHEVQSEISAQAEQSINAMSKADQEKQTAEVLNFQLQNDSVSVVEAER